MRLKQHFIIGGAAAIALYFYWGLWRALLFWGAAVLIDADHYWDYLWRSKFADWSGWRMFRYWDLTNKDVKNRNFLLLSLLHTAEAFVSVFLLAYFWYYAFFITIFWGMLFHLCLDMLDLAYRGVFFVRAYSIVEYWVRKKWMIRRGLNPDGFYKEVFEKSKRPV